MTESSFAVSLITTCKGRLAHLKETLPAFLAQGAGCEVIVVDYDCPDGAAAWVSANHPQVRVIQVHEAPIFNACKARNRGAAVATGRWLAFVDADVVLPEGFCAWLAGRAREGKFYRLRSPAPDLFGTFMCSRSDFLEVGGYDEAMHGWGGEDRELYDRLKFTLRRTQVDVADKHIRTIEHSDSERVRFAELSDKALNQCINAVYRQAKFDMMRLAAVIHLPLSLRERLRAHVSRGVIEANARGLPAASVEVDLGGTPSIPMPASVSVLRKLAYEVKLPPQAQQSPARVTSDDHDASASRRTPHPMAPARARAGSGLRDLRRVPITSGATLFCMVKNESYLLPHFLTHYRGLGVENFVFYDDRSTDGTLDLLAAQPDCSILTSDREYRETMADGRSFQVHAKSAIPESLGADRWVLTVDADEFLQLPTAYTSLPALYVDLERWGYRCVLASMVDFYPERLADRNHPRDRSPFDGSPFFDTDRLFQRSARSLRPVKRFKGVRARLLSMLQARAPAQYRRLTSERGYEHATLWKIPLIRTGSGVSLETVHSVNIQPPFDVELALAHFKFGPDLDGRIADALLSRSYFQGSIEYDFLKAAVDTLSNESLVFGGSARYAGPASLESAGFCFVTRKS